MLLVCVFVGKVSCPYFVDEHADLGLEEFILEELSIFADLPFFFLRPLSLPSSFWLPSFFFFVVASGVFIEKVGGRLMWKEPKRTWETSG